MGMTCKRPLTRVVTWALVACFFLSVPLSAGAVPQSKIDEAKAAKAKVEELSVAFGKVVDEYNGAAEAYENAMLKHEKATDKLNKTSARLDEVQGFLNKRAVDMYRSGPFAFVEVLLGAASFTEFTTTWDILSDINQQNAINIAELSTLRAEQVMLKSQLSEQEKIAAAKATEMEEKKSQIEAKIAEQKRIVAGLEAEIAELQAAEAAAAQRAAEEAAVWSPPSYSDGGGGGYVAPPPGNYTGVVAIANQFLGVPYVWGGSSPAGFDCSGLVQYCYAQMGVYLPRTTYGMLGVGSVVSVNDLQPGDLVFPHDGHVGIYAGGGSVIHAPTFGCVVRYDSLYGGFGGFMTARRVY